MLTRDDFRCGVLEREDGIEATLFHEEAQVRNRS